MNIMFFLRSIGVGFGGIEVVTINLANKLKSEGHNVCLFALYQGDSDIVSRLSKDVPLYIGKGNKVCKENICLVKEVIQKHSIQVAINQMGLHYVPIKNLKRASKGTDVKIISVYHNAPALNGRVLKMKMAQDATNNPIKKIAYSFLKFAAKKVTASSMRYVYRLSDYYMLLSKRYVREFSEFTGIEESSKILCQTNPVTVDISNFLYDPKEKKKELIYVGRIDYHQKRVHRVIETWQLLESRHPDWKLTIVGDGCERQKLEAQTAALNLNHVNFVGFAAPRPFYERASLLILSSEFEGFPLVLPECMAFGIVPVVFGSFRSVYDIIQNEENGFVVERDDSGAFSASLMAEKLSVLMQCDNIRLEMATRALESSKNYSIDSIYEQWKNLLTSVIN